MIKTIDATKATKQIRNDRKYRVLIGTPMGGGVASAQYILSILDCVNNVHKLAHAIYVRNQLRAARDNNLINEDNLKLLNDLESRNLIEIEIGLYSLSNESLLGRGRNHIAATAIRQGWDKLMFIDADARWTFDQMMNVVLSPHDFVAGVCPLKILPISLNYLPFQDDEFYHREAIRSVDSLKAMKEGHKSNLIPVAYVGTAFMSLSRKVLIDMAAASEEYQYPNPQTGHLYTHWNIFDTKPMHGKYQSEDWAACEKARSIGYNVYINADVIISHVGTFVYSPDIVVTNIAPTKQTFDSTDKRELTA